MTLQSEIEEILENAPIPDNDEELTTLVNQILSAVRKRVPEYKQIMDGDGNWDRMQTYGYHKAIDDFINMLGDS